jgi:hypothetical protein
VTVPKQDWAEPVLPAVALRGTRFESNDGLDAVAGRAGRVPRNRQRRRDRAVVRGAPSWRPGRRLAGLPLLKGVITEMHAAAGSLAEARSVLDEAFEMARMSEEHFYDAELHRIAGQIALAADTRDFAAGEQSFRAAIDDPRVRETKWWELCAAASLARPWCDQGRRHEARDLLAQVYVWFTEGFDTADLKDAMTLLDESGA